MKEHKYEDFKSNGLAHPRTWMTKPDGCRSLYLKHITVVSTRLPKVSNRHLLPSLWENLTIRRHFHPFFGRPMAVSMGFPGASVSGHQLSTALGSLSCDSAFP